MTPTITPRLTKKITDSTKALSFLSTDYKDYNKSENCHIMKLMSEYKIKNDYLKNKNEMLSKKIFDINKS